MPQLRVAVYSYVYVVVYGHVYPVAVYGYVCVFAFVDVVVIVVDVAAATSCDNVFVVIIPGVGSGSQLTVLSTQAGMKTETHDPSACLL